MSRRRDVQAALPDVTRVVDYGIVQVIHNTTPTDAQAGYAKSCTWQNVAGSAGSMFYVNIGTNSSSNWLNIC